MEAARPKQFPANYFRNHGCRSVRSLAELCHIHAPREIVVVLSGGTHGSPGSPPCGPHRACIPIGVHASQRRHEVLGAQVEWKLYQQGQGGGSPLRVPTGRGSRPFDEMLGGVPLAHHHALRQHMLDAAEGLPCALFVFDQRKSYVVVAVVAEADAGAYGYFGFIQQ